MNTRDRKKWLVTVLSEFPPRAPLAKPAPKPGDGKQAPRKRERKVTSLVATPLAAEGVAVGSGGEARAWIETVLDGRGRRRRKA
jgi:hypothetical protein